ncbi:hypothetical protein BD779DRAFT_1685813 [Infundibulicybe gibba]|nr:hypothetical protein BD779DRAFT_1685813 [Infundibulicybe gibba]
MAPSTTDGRVASSCVVERGQPSFVNRGPCDPRATLVVSGSRYKDLRSASPPFPTSVLPLSDIVSRTSRTYIPFRTIHFPILSSWTCRRKSTRAVWLCLYSRKKAACASFEVHLRDHSFFPKGLRPYKFFRPRLKPPSKFNQDIKFVAAYSSSILTLFCGSSAVPVPSQSVVYVIGTKFVLAKNIVYWGLDGAGVEALCQPPAPVVAAQHEELDTLDLDSQPSSTNDNDIDSSESSVDAAVMPMQDATAQTGDLPHNIDPILAKRVIRHLASESAAGHEKVYNQGSAIIFRYVCGILAIDHDKIKMRGKSEKRCLFEAIIKSISDDESQLLLLSAYVAENSPTARAVLGKDIMEAIWADMANTQLPTWVGSAPRNWGTTQRGKLSANQWRTICTIHLPITLIRLWKNETGRKKELLANFMDLVSAVRIANMRVSTRDQIRNYEMYIFRYISNIKALYPDEELKPTHHAALHIGSMLDLFGPVHSHSAPFFE